MPIDSILLVWNDALENHSTSMREDTLPGGLPFATTGSGEPLAVFPGMSRDSELRGAQAYQPLARVTGRTVTVVGRPRGLRRGITMRELAGLHAEALRGHFGGPVDLMGISTGGAVALQLAVDHPEVVRRLIVVAAASWLGEAGRSKLRRYGDCVAAGKSGAAILASVLAPPWIQWLVAAKIWLGKRSQRRLDPTNMFATIDAECGFDVTARLGEIRATTLIIGGGRDRAFSEELFKATAAGIPGARLVIYPKRGHIGTMLDFRFGRDVAAFLKE
jgi:pimeloyl-ACP methyl ester carboxylesterase